MFNTNNLHGALYLLHSHLNHSCQPNTRAIDVRGRLAELSGTIFVDKTNLVIARDKEIEKGDEITISYVDPSWPLELRRSHLKRDYGFTCHCPRCVDEEKKEEEKKKNESIENGKEGGVDEDKTRDPSEEKKSKEEQAEGVEEAKTDG
jgi:SET domain-containing protein